MRVRCVFTSCVAFVASFPAHGLDHGIGAFAFTEIGKTFFNLNPSFSANLILQNFGETALYATPYLKLVIVYKVVNRKGKLQPARRYYIG